MSKQTFEKPSFSPEQLLDKLRRRGLVVEDETQALAYLRYVGGYRLKGYYFPRLDTDTKRFPDGLSFAEVVRLYEFDCALRAITFQAIERIEVSIRTSIANYMSQQYGAHWFMKRSLFRDDDRYWSFEKFSHKLKSEIDRSKSVFIKYYNKIYDEPSLPPSWEIAECISFGMWSLVYKNLSTKSDRKEISNLFMIIAPQVFENWLHSLTQVRNAVAHHSRIVGTKFPKGVGSYGKAELLFSEPQSFYSAATVMNVILTRTRLPSNFQAALAELFARYPPAFLAEIGFPADWEDQPGWRRTGGRPGGSVEREADGLSRAAASAASSSASG